MESATPSFKEKVEIIMKFVADEEAIRIGMTNLNHQFDSGEVLGLILPALFLWQC